MAKTPNLNITLLEENQAGKEVLINTAISKFEDATQRSVSINVAGAALRELTDNEFTSNFMFEFTGLTQKLSVIIPQEINEGFPTERFFIVKNSSSADIEVVGSEAGIIDVLPFTTVFLYSTGATVNKVLIDSTATLALSALSDVVLNTPEDGQVLLYHSDTQLWIASNPAEAGIPDAPNNSNEYVRQGRQWVVLQKVSEAPNDGEIYARMAGQWVPLSEATGVPEAPSDGTPYIRQDQSWIELVIPESGIEEAPVDGTPYVRQDAEWIELIIPAQGIEEAPEDGLEYVRKDGDWVVSSGGPGGGIEEAPEDGKQYGRQNGAWTEIVGASPGGEGHRFWRITLWGSENGRASLNRLFFRSAPGVPEDNTGVIILASSELNTAGARAHHLNTSGTGSFTSNWVTDTTSVEPHYVTYDFTTPKVVNEVALIRGSGGSTGQSLIPPFWSPNFDIEYSDNGADFIVARSYRSVPFIATTDFRLFTTESPPPTYVEGDGINRIVRLTQAQYDSTDPKVDTTLYVVIG